MTIAEALTLRAGFANIKRQLAENGVDISEVKSVTDLPGVIGGMLPAELLPQLLENLHIDMKHLEELLIAFAGAARCGDLVTDMILGSEIVKEEDLNG